MPPAETVSPATADPLVNADVATPCNLTMTKVDIVDLLDRPATVCFPARLSPTKRARAPIRASLSQRSCTQDYAA